MSLQFLDKVSFKDIVKGEDSGAEFETDITGFVTGIKIVPGTKGTYKKYLISQKPPRAYTTKVNYGWKKEEDLTYE